jgi:hypothetical protein
MSIPPRRADAPPAAPDPELVEAVDRLLRDHGAVDPVGHAPDVVRVDTAAGPMRVKRWPAGTTADAISAERALLAALRAQGLGFIPAPVAAPGGVDSIAIEGGGRADVQTWIPGSPPLRDARHSAVPVPGAVTLEQLAVVCTGLARVHEAGAGIVRDRGLLPAPLTGYHQAVAREARATREQLQPYIRQSPHLRAWLRAADRIVPAAADGIGALVEGDARRFVASHLHIWPEHVLFLRQDGAPVLGGLVGWSGAGASSPLIDLAQAIVRLRGWSKEASEAGIGAYMEGGALLPEERRALPLIVGLDLVLVMARLLVARLQPPRGGEWIDGLGVRTALEKQAIACDIIVPMMTGYDDPAPVYKRTWEYGPRRGQPGWKPQGPGGDRQRPAGPGAPGGKPGRKPGGGQGAPRGGGKRG